MKNTFMVDQVAYKPKFDIKKSILTACKSMVTPACLVFVAMYLGILIVRGIS